MSHSHKTMDGDNRCDDNDGMAGGGYLIVVIDSPLSRDSHMSHMDVEVVGIHPNHKEGGKCGVIQMMVVVFQCFKWDSNNGDGIFGLSNGTSVYQTLVTMLMNSDVGGETFLSGNTRRYDCVNFDMLMVDCCAGGPLLLSIITTRVMSELVQIVFLKF